jgi:drug/metabolite transporter (DMT)-like permease
MKRVRISYLWYYWADLPGATRGIVLMLLSTLGFALMHSSIRHVSAELHPIQIAFFRNFFGLLAVLPWFLRLGLAPLRTRQLKLHMLRAVLNVTAMFAFFTALSLTPIAQVTALGFTAPIFAALLAMALLGEVVRLRRWAAIACGFAGTLVILRPGFQPLDPGSLLTLGSALLWGLTLILIKQLGRSDSSLTITSYMNILLTLLSVVPALVVWRTPEPGTLLWLLAIGVLGTLSQLAVAQSLKETEATVVLPFDFCKLLWVALLGYLMFGEVPDLFVWAGGILIFAGATAIAYRESRLARARARARGEARGEPGGG